MVGSTGSGFSPHGAHEGALWLDSSAPQHELALYVLSRWPYDMLRLHYEAAQGSNHQKKRAEAPYGVIYRD